ncbi:hypothetical protein GGR56DRAFT_611492 [Xylariaceae sp. FL0804]|nr:hypothetical protein GGR56DRAFT_611492 [Xylariaceae sp. FL0804]
MSSVITAVPSGPIPLWCVQEPWFSPPPNSLQQCGDSSLGHKPVDFETICCDGDIIDSEFDLFRDDVDRSLYLSDLYCCQFKGPQAGGLMPINYNKSTTCLSGTPTPLASLAATNTDNVQDYLVTYTSASYGSDTTGDFVPTNTPYCLWMYTASGAVQLEDVTVPPNTMTSIHGDCMGFSCVSTTTSSARASETPAVTSGMQSAGSGTAARASSSGTSPTGISAATSRRILGLLSFIFLLFSWRML